MKNNSSNIKQTLKKKLFINPNFEGDKEIYKELFNFVFPGYQDFINFLDETNHDKIIEYSKKILLRLAYEELCPPPTKLLINLLDNEEEQIKDDKSNYIHKDHFVHIVHLYIFGIYLYLYHDGLKFKINSFFQNLRYKRNKYSSEKKKNFRDFVIGWRHFTLYHDLAYPIQNKEYVKDNKFVEPFEKINKYLMKDLNIKYLSNVFIVYQLLSNIKGSTENKFEYLFLSRFGVIIENDNKKYNLPKHLEQLNDYKSFVKISGLNGKVIDNLFICLKEEMKLSVLVETFSGEPIAFLITKENNKEFHYVDENEKNVKILNSLFDEKNKLHKTNKSNYCWIHFISDKIIRNKTKIFDFFNSEYKNIFADFLKVMHEDIRTEMSLLSSIESIDNYCYENYIDLYNSYGYLSPDTRNDLKDDIYFNNLNKALSPLNVEIPDKISAAIKKYLEKYFKEKKLLKMFNDFGNMNQFITYILRILNNKSIIKSIEEELSASTSKNIEKVVNLSKLKEYHDKYFLNKYGNEIFKKLLKNKQIDINTYFPNLKLDDFKEHIVNNYEHDYQYIIEKYKPRHSQANKDYYDHGFFGCLLYFAVQNFYLGLINEAKDRERLSKYLNLSFGQNISTKNFQKFNHLFNEIGFAIFVHNVYPKELKESIESKKSFKIQINSNPFAFFCLLADSLQPWDRKFSVKHANIHLPYTTCSNSFDIIISDSKIKIVEKSANLNIKERMKSLKENLDEFLKNASSLIEVDLSNWS